MLLHLGHRGRKNTLPNWCTQRCAVVSWIMLLNSLFWPNQQTSSLSSLALPSYWHVYERRCMWLSINFHCEQGYQHDCCVDNGYTSRCWEYTHHCQLLQQYRKMQLLHMLMPIALLLLDETHSSQRHNLLLQNITISLLHCGSHIMYSQSFQYFIRGISLYITP